MKDCKTTFNKVLERLEPPIAQLTRSSNKWSRWSRDTKSNPNSNAESTRTSKVLERREFHLALSQTIEDFGKLGPLSKETVWLTLVSQEIGLEWCTPWSQHSSSSTSVSRSFMELSTFNSTTTTSGSPSTTSSQWTEFCSQIKQSQDSLEFI